MSISPSSSCLDSKSISEPSSPVSWKSTLSSANTASIVAPNVGQEDTSIAYEKFDKDFLVRLVKNRDRAISRLEINLDEVTKDLKAQINEVWNRAQEHHTNWLDLYRKNHDLITLSLELTEKNATMEQQLSFIKKSALISLKDLKAELKAERNSSSDYQAKCLDLYRKNKDLKAELKAKRNSSSDYRAKCLDLNRKNHDLITLSVELTEKNATMEQQLSFIKKSALISLIGLGTVALVATQFKKPQSFGANTLQIIKSLLFDRLIGFNGGAFSLAKEAASEAASIASQKASDVISSAKEAIEGYMSNPSTGSDFTL